MGHRAELAVADYLAARGFELLFANVRVGSPRDRSREGSSPLVVVVEVRMRVKGSFTAALESVTPQKRARLVRATHRRWREKRSNLTGAEASGSAWPP